MVVMKHLAKAVSSLFAQSKWQMTKSGPVAQLVMAQYFYFN